MDVDVHKYINSIITSIIVTISIFIYEETETSRGFLTCLMLYRLHIAEVKILFQYLSVSPSKAHIYSEMSQLQRFRLTCPALMHCFAEPQTHKAIAALFLFPMDPAAALEQLSVLHSEYFHRSSAALRCSQQPFSINECLGSKLRDGLWWNRVCFLYFSSLMSLLRKT